MLDVDVRDLFPTKTGTSTPLEPIYIEKGGKYAKIGEIYLNNIKKIDPLSQL